MADVVIQAGHCFRKTGSTGTRSYDGDPTEQEFAWAVATATAGKLNARGHSARAIVADPQRHEYRGEVFVAIHCDGSSSSAAHGASVGYRTDEGRDLAIRWKNAYHERGWRGFRADNYTSALQGYYGCRQAIEQGNRRAVILECGFLTNPDDEAQLASAAGQQRVVDALVDAIEQTHPAPNPEDDFMASLTDNEKAELFDAVRRINGPHDGALQTILADARLNGPTHARILAALNAQTEGIDTGELAEAISESLDDNLATAVADVLAERLSA